MWKINKTPGVFCFLFLFTILSRFPWWGQIFVSYDTTTFLLIGRELLDGNLPYTTAWDIKGPLLYVPFAFLNIFADPFFAAHIYSALSVFISALFTFLIAKKISLVVYKYRVPFFNFLLSKKRGSAVVQIERDLQWCR